MAPRSKQNVVESCRKLKPVKRARSQRMFSLPLKPWQTMLLMSAMVGFPHSFFGTCGVKADVEVVELSAPRVTHSPANNLGSFTLNQMCMLAPECTAPTDSEGFAVLPLHTISRSSSGSASSGDNRINLDLDRDLRSYKNHDDHADDPRSSNDDNDSSNATLAHVVRRKGFFTNRAAAEAYCGWPGPLSEVGYPQHAKVASLEARHRLSSKEAWETVWSDLRHVPDPEVCLAAVLSPSLQSAAAQSNEGVNGDGGNNIDGDDADGSHNEEASGAIDLYVPLLEFRDVYFGGQFVPFSPTKAYVPLATAESFGGLVQGLDKATTSSLGAGNNQNSNNSASSSRTVPLRGAMSQLADSTDPCCLASRLQWAVSGEERGEDLARALEAVEWMDSNQLAQAHLLSLDKALVAHGGGWGDYQGGAGDNYFHTLQALASVSFLLPALKADPTQKLLMRICKEPWAKLKSSFYASPQGGKWQCGIERYALELLAALDIPLDQVVHYPYDEHDPTFSSLVFKADAKAFQPYAPVVHVQQAYVQPPHVQHDAQLAELSALFAQSQAWSHLPFNRTNIVVVNRNEIFQAKCKRCVPAMNDIVARLKEEFRSAFPVVEVFGTEPYVDQVAAFRSAAAVLAPHGAALTSMLHMPTGAAVMELMHAENVNRPWFMLMAAKLQLDYWTVLSHEPAVVEGAAAKAAAKADLAEESGDLGGARQLMEEEMGGVEEDGVEDEVVEDEVKEGGGYGIGGEGYDGGVKDEVEDGADTSMNGTISENFIGRVSRLRGSSFLNKVKEEEVANRDSIDLLQNLLDAVLSSKEEVVNGADVEGSEIEEELEGAVEEIDNDEMRRRTTSTSSLVMSTVAKAGDPWAKKREAAKRKREKMAAAQAAAVSAVAAAGATTGAAAGASVGAATGGSVSAAASVASTTGSSSSSSSGALAKPARLQQRQQQQQLKQQQREHQQKLQQQEQEYQQQEQHQQQQTTAATVAALAHELPPGALTSFAGMATDFATAADELKALSEAATAISGDLMNLKAYAAPTSASVNRGYLNIDVKEVVRALRAALFKTALVGADLNAPPLASDTGAAYTNADAGVTDAGATASNGEGSSHHRHGGHRGHHGHRRIAQ